MERKSAIASREIPRQSKGAIADGKGVEVWDAIASSSLSIQSKSAISLTASLTHFRIS
ncbi:MAG: hypothetical protein AB1589_01940 [Cyanobacteriota bacterium]